MAPSFVAAFFPGAAAAAGMGASSSAVAAGQGIGTSKVAEDAARTAWTIGGDGSEVPAYDIYNYGDRSELAERKRAAILELARADMDRVNKERALMDKNMEFEGLRVTHSLVHDRWAKATAAFEIASTTANIHFMAEVQAGRSHAKASRERRAAEAGVEEARKSAALAQERVRETAELLERKKTTREKAVATLQGFDNGSALGTLGDFSLEESSGERKRQRDFDDEEDGSGGGGGGGGDCDGGYQPKNDDFAECRPRTAERKHIRPVRSILSEDEVSQAVAKGLEAEQALRARVEAQAAESAAKIAARRASLVLALEVMTSECASTDMNLKNVTIEAGQAVKEVDAAKCAYDLPEAIRTEAEAKRIHQETVKAANPYVSWVNSEVLAQKRLLDWSEEMGRQASNAWELRQGVKRVLDAAEARVSKAARALSSFPGGDWVDISRHSLFKAVVEDANQREARANHQAEGGAGSGAVIGGPVVPGNVQPPGSAMI